MIRRALALAFVLLVIGVPVAAQETAVVATEVAADDSTPLAEAMLPPSVELDGQIVAVLSSAWEVPFGPALPPTGLMQTAQRRPSSLATMYVSLTGLQSYDAYSTIAALRRGAVEANPVVRGAHPATLVALKAATTAGSIYLAERLWRRHRRVAAVVLMGVTNGMMAAVAARNASVLHR